jgi:hypothetical protein
MDIATTRLLDRLRWWGLIEWQALHSDDHARAAELEVAGLVHRSGPYVCYGR